VNEKWVKSELPLVDEEEDVVEFSRVKDDDFFLTLRGGFL
jgi:hypothetical protein